MNEHLPVFVFKQDLDSLRSRKLQLYKLVPDATNANMQRVWKIYGPDQCGSYGGAQGIGGLEALVDETTQSPLGMINDMWGNVAAYTDGTNVKTSMRAGAYGPLPGQVPPAYSSNNLLSILAATTAWQGRRTDPTGFYYFGARSYDPLTGRFLSKDPEGYKSSLSLYDYASGDPVNLCDPDGRCTDGKAIIGYLNGSPVFGDPGSPDPFKGIGNDPPDGWVYAPHQLDIQSSPLSFAEPGPDVPIIGAIALYVYGVVTDIDDAVHGYSLSQPVDDAHVTAEQLTYEWAQGIGPWYRLFDENSVMGKQMMRADYVISAIDTFLSNAADGDTEPLRFYRSLTAGSDFSDKLLNAFTYPPDFVADVFVNPARAYQGSIGGYVSAVSRIYSLNGQSVIDVNVYMTDVSNAASGTHFPNPFSLLNYASLEPVNNPYGAHAPFGDIRTDYNLNFKAVPLKGVPWSSTPSLQSILKTIIRFSFDDQDESDY